jgi:hypothetical protein
MNQEEWKRDGSRTCDGNCPAGRHTPHVVQKRIRILEGGRFGVEVKRTADFLVQMDPVVIGGKRYFPVGGLIPERNRQHWVALKKIGNCWLLFDDNIVYEADLEMLEMASYVVYDECRQGSSQMKCAGARELRGQHPNGAQGTRGRQEQVLVAGRRRNKRNTRRTTIRRKNWRTDSRICQ